MAGSALGSAVEHSLHTRGVGGSNPPARTIFLIAGVLALATAIFYGLALGRQPVGRDEARIVSAAQQPITGVLINAGDASVKGGAWYPLSVKKTVRALDVAIENRLPVVHLCDSAGGFLPLQAELFADKYYAGRIFRNQCILSKMGVQQVAVVLGHCTAGGAYVPGLSDYNVIVRGTGASFLTSPGTEIFNRTLPAYRKRRSSLVSRIDVYQCTAASVLEIQELDQFQETYDEPGRHIRYRFCLRSSLQ